MIEETYRCIHCGIDIEGSRAWVTHLTSEEHRARVKRGVLQAAEPDPDDYRDSRRNGDFPDDDAYPSRPYRGEQQWD